MKYTLIAVFNLLAKYNKNELNNNTNRIQKYIRFTAGKKVQYLIAQDQTSSDCHSQSCCIALSTQEKPCYFK